MQVNENIIQKVVVEDKIRKITAHRQILSIPTTAIGEDAWRNGGVYMEVVECGTAKKYISDQDNLPRWTSA